MQIQMVKFYAGTIKQVHVLSLRFAKWFEGKFLGSQVIKLTDASSVRLHTFFLGIVYII